MCDVDVADTGVCVSHTSLAGLPGLTKLKASTLEAGDMLTAGVARFTMLLSLELVLGLGHQDMSSSMREALLRLTQLQALTLFYAYVGKKLRFESLLVMPKLHRLHIRIKDGGEPQDEPAVFPSDWTCVCTRKARSYYNAERSYERVVIADPAVHVAS